MYKKLINWLNELKSEFAEPNNFNEYFFGDIINFLLDNPEMIKGKYFIECKSKNDVTKRLNAISSYIVKNLEVELIISNYFSG